MNRLDYLRSLIRFAFRNNPLLYACLGLSVLSVGLELAAMTVLMPLATVIANGATANATIVRLLGIIGLPSTGDVLLLAFLTLFAGRLLTQLVSQSMIIYLGRRMLLQLTTRAFSALIRHVPVRAIEQKSIGYFITLAGDEASRASTLIVSVTQFVTTSLLSTLYFLAVVSYSRPIALAVVIFLAVTFAALFESFRISHRLGIRQIEQSQTAGSLFLDSLNGLRSVRSFSAEDYVTKSYFQQIRSYVRTLALIEVISLVARLGPALLLVIAVAVISVWPSMMSRLELDLPFVVTIIILLMRFFPIVGQGLNLALRVVADARAGRDVTQIIDDYENATAMDSSGPRIARPIERIEAVDVHFEHLDGKPVLRDFNAVLKRGASYAIVGASGSGKSTFLDLLLGFYVPASGKILVNGTPFSQLSSSDLRTAIVLVSQDTAIFNDTVANNLRLGLGVPQVEIERACRIACIDEFIAGLPDGYETLLNYRGSNLSGGQKQRIGIARAVLRHPDVLLLDESTSALDSSTREQVVENLLKEFKNCILVFVTHDAFVMSKVDKVLNLSPNDEGTIVPKIASSAAEF